MTVLFGIVFTLFSINKSLKLRQVTKEFLEFHRENNRLGANETFIDYLSFDFITFFFNLGILLSECNQYHFVKSWKNIWLFASSNFQMTRLPYCKLSITIFLPFLLAVISIRQIDKVTSFFLQFFTFFFDDDLNTVRCFYSFTVQRFLAVAQN